jgi:hypothetical protein
MRLAPQNLFAGLVRILSEPRDEIEDFILRGRFL